MDTNFGNKERIGWREWAALPDLGIGHIKCKIDTGARSSALHAFNIEPFEKNNIKRVRFCVHPQQRNVNDVVKCVSDMVDERTVTDSGGHKEKRPVIVTKVVLGPHVLPVETTLTNRNTMKAWMLLGRSAIAGRFLVDPKASYIFGKKKLSKPKRNGADALARKT